MAYNIKKSEKKHVTDKKEILNKCTTNEILRATYIKIFQYSPVARFLRRNVHICMDMVQKILGCKNIGITLKITFPVSLSTFTRLKMLMKHHATC